MVIVRVIGLLIAAVANALAIGAFYEAFFTGGDKAILSVVFGGPVAAIIMGVAAVALCVSGWAPWYWALVAIPVIVMIIGLSFFVR